MYIYIHLCDMAVKNAAYQIPRNFEIFALILESFQHSRHVGKCISTKKVGSDEREDITNLYKYNEKSPEERKAFENAFSFGKGTKNWIGEFNIEEEENVLTLGMLYGNLIP